MKEKPPYSQQMRTALKSVDDLNYIISYQGARYEIAFPTEDSDRSFDMSADLLLSASKHCAFFRYLDLVRGGKKDLADSILNGRYLPQVA